MNPSAGALHDRREVEIIVNSNHSKEVERLLRTAGWFPKRRVDLAPWDALATVPFNSAREVLAEFGGLVIGETGRGIDLAKSDVDLRPKEYNRGFVGEPDLEAEAGQRLYPVATAHRSNGDVWIDESGRVYLEGDFPDGEVLRFLGSTFSEALEVLLLGKRRPNR